MSLAVLVRLAIAPYVGGQIPFAAFYITVTLIVYVAGTGPAVVGALLGLVLGNVFFIPPLGTFGATLAQLITGFAYTLTCGAIVAFGHGLRQERARAETSAAEATRRGEELAREAAERREAELEVRRLNAELGQRVEEFRAVVERSPVGIAIAMDPGCEHIWANPAMRSILGLPAGANASQTAPAAERPGHRVLSGGALVPPEDMPMQLSARYGTPVHDRELEIVRPDGTRRTLLVNAEPLFEETGKTRGSVAMGLDITERKELERQLRSRAEELAVADRRKDEFLATLAHELRNPLAPMTNALGVMRLSKFDRTALERASAVLERQLDHMVRLVDDLLEVSRITRGRIALKREWIDLADVVKHTVETSAPQFEAAQLTLEVSVPAEPLLVNGDPTRLGQIVANLLNNASKFTDAGGKVTVTVERADRGHDADVDPSAVDAVVRVKDTGVGIPADMLERIFEMFSQSDRTLERSRGGLGIGLSLARALVEMHGGVIEAHSGGQNQGSEFVVRLPARVPRRESAAAEALPSPHSEDTAGVLRRILVVDDNRDAAESMAELMRMLGHEVAVGHDGPAALSLARSFRPDLVLLDIGLPGMSGYEVARNIRREPGLEQVALVAVTGWGQDEDRRRSREAGFDRHLVKPADLDVLQELLIDTGPKAVHA